MSQLHPTRTIRHLIDGESLGDPQRERRNPADPSDVVSVTVVGGVGEVSDAVAAARAAQPSWAATPAPARGAILTRAAEVLADRAEQAAVDLTREEGKTLREAGGEVQRAVDILRYYGGEGWRLGGDTFASPTGGTMVFTKREPVGVVAVITPWNFPIAIPAWKIAPALVSGNSVVFKPASITGVSAHHLADALITAGLPSGVLNIVHGSGATVGDCLIEDQGVDAVTFTGSTSVGARIRQAVADRRTRIQLEMGGKNPLVVLDDADMEKAARIAAIGGFGLTGQACTATSRVIVTPGAVDPLTEALGRVAGSYHPGNGLDEGVLMGPVVDSAQFETDTTFVRMARDEGGEVVFGGEPGEGLAFPPTLIRGVRPHHQIARREVFGPVIGLIEASDFDEAIEIANDIEFGLSAGICTNDLGKAHIFVDRVRAGVVKVNRPTTGLDLNAPFGGIKASSTGTFREQGPTAVDFFTWSKTAYVGYRD